MTTRSMLLPPWTLALSLALSLGACRTAPPPAAAALPASEQAAPPAARPGIDAGILDRAVSPCDDFYRFACGGWIDRTALPPEKSSYTRSFTAIDDQVLEELRAIAEADAAGKLDPADRFPEKVGDLWAACMDEAGVEAHGLADLRAVWARIDAVKDLPGLAAELGELHRQGVDAAFEVGSEQDAKDATQMIGVVAQGGLTLPDRDFYTRTDAKSAALQADLRAYVATMFALAGEPKDRAEGDAKAIYDLEHALAEAHWTRVESRDPQRVYHRVERAGLDRLAPRFDWGRYLAALGHPQLAAWNATTPAALSAMDALLGSAPLDAWKAYLRWWVLTSAARERALPRAFTEARFAFVSKHFSGAKVLEPRWKACVRLESQALGEAIGQAFVRRRFGEDGKLRAREIISQVEAAMGRDLDALPWMDAPTRRAAHQKLERLVNKVGYPDRWRDYSAMRVDRTSLFRSLLSTDAFEVNRELEKIGKPVDRGEWNLPPQTVNAFYDPSMNEMVFPAGILQPPFFTRGGPAVVNYGAIGMVMGHELTHGFDDEGRQFDAQGNLRDWWTPSVAKDFDRRAACIADQFDGYVAVDDLHVNGKLTLGENIADLGGLALSFAAWQAQAKATPAAPEVDGFTPEQTFFVAFAQAWCAKERPELMRLLVQTDPHSPPQWRVNGPLSNLPAFQEAFRCKPGDRMARPAAQRCELW
jgi:endothelin-converting enzyme/putative endopeptidase